MKSKWIKICAGVALLAATATAFAAGSCCGDLSCCLEHLICCFQ